MVDEKGTIDTTDDSGGGLLSEETPPESNEDHNNNGDPEQAFAQAETAAVFRMKLCLLAVLLLSTVGVALAVYFYSSRAEKEKFESSFVDASAKIYEGIGGSLDLTLGAVDSFVVGLVSFAHHTNATWPFVTLPDFAIRAAKLRSLSKAFFLCISPLVTDEERADWEKYSLENDGWVQDGLAKQKKDKNYHGRLMDTYEPYGVIYGNNGDSQGPGPYFPTWQAYPVVPVWAPYNWDYSTYTPYQDALPELEAKRVVISKVGNFPNPDDPASVAETDVATAWAQDFIGKNEDAAEPYLEINYPIIEGATDEVTIIEPGKEEDGDQRLVAVLILNFFFRDVLLDILPNDSTGITCVVTNPCSPTFTYEINGPDVAYLGKGDQHDSSYDYLQQSSSLLDLRAFSTRDQTYTGIPLSGEKCPYDIYLYPSARMENDYTTLNPIIFTIVAVLIFAFTSLVFFIYDCNVERRQKKVMNTAVQSSANVSLLEDMVKERTRTLEITNQRLEEANREVRNASAAQLRHFACMSHEIRTPLNCIIGLSSLLRETDLNPMQEESMRMIITSGDLLLTVVNDVLDYSKLESGNVDILIRRSNLQETLTSVVHSIEAKARSNNVSLQTCYDAALYEFINTDSRRLQQILYNILGNAVKFSREGGVVELGVELCSFSKPQDDNDAYSPRVWATECASEKQDQMKLRFIVKDYGKGIKREDFGKIFRPFLQASAETERIYGGSGLGLSITTKLVHRMGGSISVSSQEGKWTKFCVDFPFTQPLVDIQGLSKRLEHTTIFLASNDEMVLDQISSVFRTYSVEFETFHDMKELEASILTPQGSLCHDRSYICCVDEDLYDPRIYSILKSCAKSFLFTFGRRYSVKESDNHYLPLVRLLPSVLMESMAARVTSNQPMSNLHDSSSSSSITVPYSELRLLIAEDNIVNQKVLLRILNRLGVTDVEIVDNGQKAVEREASKEFDMVLMDYQMPVMNGVQACRLISQRKGGNYAPAKVIFITAHVSDEFKAECLAAGGLDFLPKPFTIDRIQECFQRVYAGF